MSAPENPFRAALEWFGPNGERWGKGEFVLPNGTRCAYGALAEVLNVDIQSIGALPFIYEDQIDAAAEALYPDRWGDEGLYGPRKTAAVNDHDETTFDDIRVIFEKAAVRWDERVS